MNNQTAFITACIAAPALALSRVQREITQDRIRQWTPDGIVPYAAGTNVATVLAVNALPFTYNKPAANEPTANFTEADLRPFRNATNGAGWHADRMRLHVLLAVATILVRQGIQGLVGLLALPEEDRSDVSHLYAGPVVMGTTWKLAEAIFESHEVNMDRIACSVFSRHPIMTGLGGCICNAPVPCKSLPGLPRAIINGIQV